MSKSELDRHRPEPEPKRYEVAPCRFRKRVIPEMVKLLDWQKLKDLTVENYNEGPTPEPVLDWQESEQNESGPLLTCEWWRFLLIVQAASNDPTREVQEWSEDVDTTLFFGLEDQMMEDAEKASWREAEFERKINALCQTFWLGYELRGGEFVRDDLQETADLRERNFDMPFEPTTKADLDSAWKNLNAIPQPNYREATRSVRNIIEVLRDEFERLVDPQRPNSPSKELVKGLNKLLHAASDLAAHPSGADPTKAEAVGAVSIAYALIGYLNALQQDSTEAPADSG